MPPPHPPLYQFVNGNGDVQHSTLINSAAQAGFEVVSTTFNPDEQAVGKRLQVLMVKHQGL